ncbi:MAG: glycosyltransferase 87 family protein [Mycobacteriales bacterium]
MSVVHTSPSLDDPVVRGLSTMVGGPLGRHARVGGNGWWTPVKVLLLLTVLTCSLGWWQKSACRVHPWSQEYQYTRLCYTDVFALYYAEGLAKGERPYLDHPVEYPVVIGGLMQAAASTVRVLPAPLRARGFYDLTALFLAGCALVVTLTTSRLAGRRRPWDAAMVALAPVLIVEGTINWDLAAAALTGLAMLAWARRRPGWAGVFLGLGTATKLYPALLLLALFLLCLRAGRLRPWVTATAAAAAAWLVVDVPVWVAAPGGFARFFAFSRTRGVDWGSLWYAVEHVRGRALDSVVAGGSPARLNALVMMSLVLGLVGIALLALRAARRPRLAQVVFLVLVAFLLTNKVYSPQYSLWILPLAVLARPRWTTFLAWQLGEVLEFAGVFYYLIGIDKGGQGLPFAWFLGSVLLRDALLLGLATLVVREVLHPQLDVVRRDEVDDPAGGVLDEAPDRPGWRPVPAAESAGR